MKWLTSRVLPVTAAVMLLTLVMVTPAVHPTGPMNLDGFGKIVVVDQGRTKPLDTLARTMLLIVSDRQTWTDAAGERRPAIRFLADAMTASLAEPAAPARAHDHAVFRIENQQLLGVLGLGERRGLRYSYLELEKRFDELSRQVALGQQVDPDRRTRFQEAVMELAGKLSLYSAVVRWRVPLAVPPTDDAEWRTLFGAAHAGQTRGQAEEGLTSLTRVLNAYAHRDAEAFNHAVAQHRGLLRSVAPRASERAWVEWQFNRIDLFGKATVLYVMVFVLGCLSWLGWRRPLGRTALGLAVGALVIHTLALVVRIYLQGRPPVTNLYSSAIFVGWGCVVFALILEATRRDAIGLVLGAAAGFATLRIAHLLSLEGDTLEMMRAVLDTNLWLATHVTTITLGYAATFMAGLFGIIFVLRGMFTPTLEPATERSLGRMIYGIVCFALLLSFVGTVLGGIWADQSWGRFWGWDPKENGALLLVLWNVLILHARWDGMVGDRGVAVMAIFGNVVTGWSWFGVNMLGAGLHSYGFMEGAAFWLVFFCLVNVSLMGIGMLPRGVWWSYAQREAADGG